MKYELIEKINKLKKEKNAVILVHNYQPADIYDIADFTGDSFGLSLEASRTDADIIIFCGVHFMAETAHILSPHKKVLLPALDAGCPMANMVNPEDLKKMKEKYPTAAVVSYMNTTAETKSLSDVICTSGNAVKVVNFLPHKQIIFVPDENLGSYVAENTDKEIILWDGYCHVHKKFSPEGIVALKKKYPEAEVIVHPECPKAVRDHADYINSTSGMVTSARNSKAKEFIIATEIGMLEMLRREVPGKKFIIAPPSSSCSDMKKISLELVLETLIKEKNEIILPVDIREKAVIALKKMLEIGN